MVIAAVLRWAPALRFASQSLRGDDEAADSNDGKEKRYDQGIKVDLQSRWWFQTICLCSPRFLGFHDPF